MTPSRVFYSSCVKRNFLKSNCLSMSVYLFSYVIKESTKLALFFNVTPEFLPLPVGKDEHLLLLVLSTFDDSRGRTFYTTTFSLTFSVRVCNFKDIHHRGRPRVLYSPPHRAPQASPVESPRSEPDRVR